MQILDIKKLMALTALLGIAALAFVLNPVVKASDDPRVPELPAACGNLQVPAGNRPFFHVYAVGVQVYRWNGTSWAFVAPIANLYSNEGYNGKVGFHYVGPTWESNSGSKVVGSNAIRCTADANAIPWLRLEAAPTDDPGIFRRVTYIQRTDTTGGLAPAEAGTTVGEEKRVPYTAEYYFYRAED